MHLIDIDKLSDKCNKRALIQEKLEWKNLELEFIYDSIFINTKDLRDFIEIIVDLLFLWEKNKSRFILITDELNNNAIEYWTKKWWRNKLRVISKELENWKINFVIEVEDSWDWKFPKKALELETMRAHKLKRGYFWHKSIRWRWLFLIIIQIVDRLYFRDSKEKWRGLIVWIKSII